MGKKGRTGVLKRQREAKKAEKAALKRDQSRDRKTIEPETEEDRVATAEDLEGYGFPVSDDSDETS